MRVDQAIQQAVTKINSESARLDSEVLLAFILERNKTWLKTWPDYQLSTVEQDGFAQLVERRANGEPVAYLTGQRDFWTLDLATNNSTLIPRPETELLVEQALQFLEDQPVAKVLDLGTGTGAIALAIASERPHDRVIGADFNASAVELAVNNSQRNKLSNAEFVCSDWFTEIPQMKFDLIVSNPPYVAAGDPHLQQGDLVFEPDSALIAGDNGFADIEHIIDLARQFLTNGGALMFEHGYQQANRVTELFVKNGYSQIETIKDLSGLDRVTQGIWRD
ncbi:peptide chain release factor N(5)-glutamine methyltransferase [Aliikangiella marina]|uniref:Release factor glutamine methyltransferase n=1 Tax=Aliikangiella marina TaxID=1712262 RepID=A0A545TH07_9GAMM|nr:peptide chain release factor N(5)-glutamine methyltransferase [Aliikangiella marina]TQV76478.1 peptide chain release factor N(5)-glutamine methyltransferase [Aliikangiella marina]